MPATDAHPAFGALDAFYVRDAVEGNLRARLLELRRGGGGWGGVSRREGASAVSGSGTALTTTLHWRLSTLATHTSTSSSHGGGVGARMSAREGR